jgi:uncharacterized protein (DUF1015 family)
MTRIRPFAALRYDRERVRLADVIVPPYDVIAAADRERFYARDPHNAIRLELTRRVEDEAGADYADVRRTLEAWGRSGVLAQDPRPAFYALRQSFTGPDGKSHVRDGFFGLLHLEDYARRGVRPHERTLAGPKADRLKMLRATRANLSIVFLLYEDREETLLRRLAPALEAEPLAEASDEAGATHRLARIDAPAEILALQEFFAPRPLVIADGHHRYETALAYRDEQRAAHPEAGPDAPCEWILAYFANAFAPGSLLLPIHRLILRGAAPSEREWSEKLPGWRCESAPLRSAEELPGLLAAQLAPLRDRHAFAADDASGRLRIFSRPLTAGAAAGELSVRVIHREVIEGVFGLDEQAVRDGAIDYPKSALQTALDVRAGRGVVALYLNPLVPEDVFRVTAAGEVLPQKSTFFYPKLPTGLVFRRFEDAS